LKEAGQFFRPNFWVGAQNDANYGQQVAERLRKHISSFLGEEFNRFSKQAKEQLLKLFPGIHLPFFKVEASFWTGNFLKPVLPATCRANQVP
jgi:hypothetical protein